MNVNVLLIWVVLGAAALTVLGAVAVGLISGVSPDPYTLRYFSPEFLQKAAEYERVNLTLFLARQAVTLVFLMTASVWAARYFQVAPKVSLITAAGYIFLFLFIFYILNLPLSFYQGYVVEHRFGFSTQTAGSWFLDYFKSGLISLGVSTGGLTGLYILMVRWPARWWLLAGTGFSLFILLSTYLFPIIIDPLFHNFTPLEDEALSSEIVSMAERAEIKVEQVLVADASRRTHKSNAYFTGIGKSKRIVIYDNLLKGFTAEEVLVVIAHEMAHWRHSHIVKGIVMSIAGAFISLYLFRAFLKMTGLGLNLKLIPLALLFFALVSLVAMPVQNAVSRSFERQADRGAITLTENPEAFVALKQNLAEANLAAVQPHPLIKMVLYSHPPIIERIRSAER
ncbi:MAG: endopeptidase [Firmicutes bacterium HGW-Firmicutes-13]|nr:MAG: endopeptidase [Firmicutes bacterium HGW-Firmicutes-13]